MKRLCVLRVLLCLMCICMCMPLMLAACGSKEPVLQNEITEVSLTKDGTEVKVSAALTDGFLDTYGDGKVYLFELTSDMSTGADINALDPVDELKAKQRLTFTVPLLDGVRTRLYSSFVIASYDEKSRTYSVQTAPVAIPDPHTLAEDEAADAQPEVSVKGLISDYPADAIRLGISYTMVDVPMERLMLNGWREDSVGYVWNGSTRYLRGSSLDELDELVHTYTAAGVWVYLRFTLSNEGTDATAGVPAALYMPNVAAGADSCAVNMQSRQAADMLEGFFDFMAERYATDASELGGGRCAGFVIGSRVNRAEGFANGATPTVAEYVTNYEKLVRLANQALKSHDPDGRVYISLDSDWSGRVSGGWGVQTFLSAFAGEAAMRGDYDWQVACELYADSPTVWIEDRVLDADRLTVNSFSILTDLLGSEKYRTPAGEQRRLMISRLDIPATDPSGNAADTQQAASYAYAYSTAVANGKVEALLYGAYADNADGLRRTEADGTPGEKRVLYDLFTLIDTSEAANVVTAVGEVIGSSYVKLESTLSGLSRPVTRIEQDGTLTGYQETAKASDLFSFRNGSTNGFVGAGNLTYLELASADTMGDACLYARFDRVSRQDPMGVTATVDAADLIGGKDLILDLYAGRADAAVSDKAAVTVRLVRPSTGLVSAGDGEVIYEATVSDVSASIWQTATFDISEFTKLLNASDTVELSVWVEGRDGTAYVLGLDTVHITGTSASGGFSTVLLLVIVAVVLVAAVGAAVFLYVRNRGFYHR